MTYRAPWQLWVESLVMVVLKSYLLLFSGRSKQFWLVGWFNNISTRVGLFNMTKQTSLANHYSTPRCTETDKQHKDLKDWWVWNKISTHHLKWNENNWIKGLVPNSEEVTKYNNKCYKTAQWLKHGYNN